jgi:SpoVK/Ycf46/Vps4 family AAA+-type ATPase
MTKVEIISEIFDRDEESEFIKPIVDRNHRALCTYALNIHRNVGPASPEGRALVNFLSSNRHCLSLPDQLFMPEDRVDPELFDVKPGKPISKARWQIISQALSDAFESNNEIYTEAKGLDMVAAALGFDLLDAAIFALIFRYRSFLLMRLFDVVSFAMGGSKRMSLNTEAFSVMLDVPVDEVARKLRPRSRLRASGAIRVDGDGDITLAQRLRRIVNDCTDSGSDVYAELLGAPVGANLPWTSFKHLGTEIEIALSMLRQALNTKQPGVHILFYGPPGTGKSQLAATLAAEIGAVLHTVGEQDEHGGEPTRGERLSDILLAQSVGADRPVIYLFDEAEDLFRPSQKEGEPDPKIFVHRLLETATVPMIWAANDLEAFSPAVLRRMSMCIKVKLPSQTRRAELWQEVAKDEKVELNAQAANRLARLIPSAPSVARTALRAAHMAGGSVDTVEIVARGMARAIGHGRMLPPEPPSETSYDPALSRADIDLADLSARLVREDAPKAVSLLLSGPPGTGKSAYARYLAGQMGLPVLQKRGSDIFGSYVGETERNIARAFAEAQESKSFLIFDEADSLLAERASAIRNWEVSEVNEMLTWMEHHPLPFVCTTNLPERLDRASLRRFLIRVTFKYLAPTQSAILFQSSFSTEPPAGLAKLDRLVPADFSRIAKRVTALGQRFEQQPLMELLTAEMEGRDGAANPIGFAPARAC